MSLTNEYWEDPVEEILNFVSKNNDYLSMKN